MLRKIVGFHQDEEKHWVADLDCGHAQHTRHDPPFFERPWVLTEAGRSEHIGVQLNCVRCDRHEIPEGYVPYRRTPTFTEETIPQGLKQNHSTKPGVWGIISVLAGQLRYRIHDPYNMELLLEPGVKGIVLPEVEHDVQPEGAVEFYVEFWRHLSQDGLRDH